MFFSSRVRSRRASAACWPIRVTALAPSDVKHRERTDEGRATRLAHGSQVDPHELTSSGETADRCTPRSEAKPTVKPFVEELTLVGSRVGPAWPARRAPAGVTLAVSY